MSSITNDESKISQALKSLLSKSKDSGSVSDEKIRDIVSGSEDPEALKNALNLFRDNEINIESDYSDKEGAIESVSSWDPIKVYLKRISPIRLLTNEEECTLAKRIESAKHEIVERIWSLDFARKN